MSFWVLGISEAMGLAAVALLGYMVGRWAEARWRNAVDGDREGDVGRAAEVAAHLERIADALRQSLASHHAQVLQFKRKLREVRELPGEQTWQILCDEAEMVLEPTMQLASQLSQAYDQLRQQSQELATFTARRSDALTGVAAPLALEEQIDFHLRCQQSNRHAFSIAILTLDARDANRQGKLDWERKLQNVAHLLQRSVRGNDFVARYGSEEFAVLLPNTELQGANQFGRRIRTLAVTHLGVTLSVGLAESDSEDDTKSLLGRADSALYSARTDGGNAQFFHGGTSIRRFPEVPADTLERPGPRAKKRKTIVSNRSEDTLDQLAEELIEVGV
jgi:diguanylate cyclase